MKTHLTFDELMTIIVFGCVFKQRPYLFKIYPDIFTDDNSWVCLRRIQQERGEKWVEVEKQKDWTGFHHWLQGDSLHYSLVLLNRFEHFHQDIFLDRKKRRRRGERRACCRSCKLKESQVVLKERSPGPSAQRSQSLQGRRTYAGRVTEAVIQKSWQ